MNNNMLGLVFDKILGLYNVTVTWIYNKLLDIYAMLD